MSVNMAAMVTKKGVLYTVPHNHSLQVGASMIDAHSGALGMLASPSAQGQVIQSHQKRL